MVRFHLPGHGALAPIVLAAAVAACFDGADALGLPCEQDADCGLDQSCIEGFCGGPQDGTGTGMGMCGDGVLDEAEECDDGEANAADAPCTPNCTTNVCGDGFAGPGEECDDGSANADDAACKLDCTANVCGDGFAGPGEACDEGEANADTGACRPDCTLAECGDGFVAPDEECDDAGESDACDTDCSVAECGDGMHNASAGEACDGGSACLDDCRAIFFLDDMEQGMGDWSQEVVNGSVVESWVLSQTRPSSGQTSWYSGPAPASPQAPGSLRLMSPEIDLTGATAPVELTLQHWYEFDDCGMSMTRGDGGLVEVRVEGSWTRVDPVVPYPHMLEGDTCGMMDNNPLAPSPAWADDTGGAFREVKVVLDDYVGETIQIGFHVAYDCNNCGPAEGWYVDDVLVAGY